MEQDLLDLIKEEQNSDEEFVANNSSEESRDTDLYSTERDSECQTQWDEVTNNSKERLKQGSSTLQCIYVYQLKYSGLPDRHPPLISFQTFSTQNILIPTPCLLKFGSKISPNAILEKLLWHASK